MVHPEYEVIEYLKGALTKTIKTPNSIFRKQSMICFLKILLGDIHEKH